MNIASVHPLRSEETCVVPRWQVTRAVRRSNLTSSQRLVMFVLADIADAETSVIPHERERSLTELARETGLGRSTVARTLGEIEADGWVVRDRPTLADAWGKKARTQYRLAAPPSELTSPALGLVPPLEESTDVQETTSPAAGLVPEGDQSTSPAAGPVDDRLVPQRDTNYKPTTSTFRTSSSSPTTSSADDQETEKKSKPKKRRTAAELNADRPDVAALCTRLVERMVANGCARPTITDAWRTEARLLLDRDGRNLAKALALIDWCQANTFWRSNIQSMPTFREKYDALRLKALAEWESKQAPKQANGHVYLNPDDPISHYADMEPLT